VVSDIIAVEAVRACLKVRRRINVAHSELAQIRDDLARLRKREPPIELQPVGGRGDSRVMLSFHAGGSRKTVSMTKQIRMTKTEIFRGAPLCLSGFVIPSSFDIRASSFCCHILSGTLIPRRSRPRCNTRAVRSHNIRREPRAGSSDFNTGQAS
jgi:hypothetical protein